MVIIAEEDTRTLLIHRISFEDIYQRQGGASSHRCPTFAVLTCPCPAHTSMTSPLPGLVPCGSAWMTQEKWLCMDPVLGLDPGSSGGRGSWRPHLA